MTPGLPLMKNLLTPLAKSVLVPLGLTGAASATDVAIQKKISDSGTTLVFPNEETDDIIKIVKSFNDSGLLIKGVSETIESQIKEQKGWSLGMLASTLGASLLGNMLAGRRVVRAGEGTNRTRQDF